MRAADERFWAKVIKGPYPEDCWFWVGAISDDGYGRFTLNKNGTTKAVRPHRYAYYLATGVWLNDMPLAYARRRRTNMRTCHRRPKLALDARHSPGEPYQPDSLETAS